MNLIIDINNAFHKSYHISKKMYGDKINEKLMFNKFIIDLFSTIRLFKERNNIEKIICCFDSENIFRKVIYPNYKSNRSKQDDSFYSVFNYSKEYLSKIGFIVSCLDGLEADDLIGLWVDELKDQICCIISNDEDVRQLIDDNVCVFNNQSTRKLLYIHQDTFKLNVILKEAIEYEKVNPKFILASKIVLGCSGDMVPKLLKGRVGEKTFRKKIYDQNFDGDLSKLFEQLNKVFCDNITIEQIKLNQQLVDLSGKFCPPHFQANFFLHKENVEFTYKGNYIVD